MHLQMVQKFNTIIDAVLSCTPKVSARLPVNTDSAWCLECTFALINSERYA